MSWVIDTFTNGLDIPDAPTEGEARNGTTGWFNGVDGDEGNENNEGNEANEGNEGNESAFESDGTGGSGGSGGSTGGSGETITVGSGSVDTVINVTVESHVPQRVIDVVVETALAYAEAVNTGQLHTQRNLDSLNITIADLPPGRHGFYSGGNNISIDFTRFEDATRLNSQFEGTTVHELSHAYNPSLHLTGELNPEQNHSREFYEFVDEAADTIGVSAGQSGTRHPFAGNAPSTIATVPLADQSASEADVVGGYDGTDEHISDVFDSSDTLYGSHNSNIIIGAGGNDQMHGAGGDDTMSGGVGNDTVAGNEGADELSGHTGNDRMYGGAGNDNLNGGAGADTLDGGAGNDFLNGGWGWDLLIGGSGADSFYHHGVATGFGTEWIEDFSHSEGDRLVTQAAGHRDDFVVTFATTPGRGSSDEAEAFVRYVPTGQVAWILQDGEDLDSIIVQTANGTFDLL